MLELIYSPFSYRFRSGQDEPDEVPNELYDAAKVGDIVVHSMAAPGYGERHYKITKKTPEGVFGICIKDTTGIFSPGDVR